jgi:hypothetical protein
MLFSITGLSRRANVMFGAARFVKMAYEAASRRLRPVVLAGSGRRRNAAAPERVA